MPTPSLVNIPFITAPNVLFSQIPESGAGDFTVTRTTSPVVGQSTRVNAAGLIELVADNVPRLDYPLGGAVNGCPALLVEPAATNGIRNNSMVGAVAGSPGTLPTNWTNSGSTLTRQSVATGTLNGIPYVDIRISGTASNTFHDVFWDANNVIAALVGQDWVASCYLQIIAQPNPPFSYTLAMREFNSSNVFLGFFQGAALSISTTSFNRFSFTRALNQATVAFVQPSLFVTLVIGQTYDFTIRIGYPQMERGTVATSVIPTTTQAITRAADVITDTTASGVIGQTEGTIYAEVDVRNLGISRSFMNVQDASYATNAVRIESQVNNWRIQIRAASVSILDQTIISPTFTTGTYKIAMAYSNAANGVVFAVNGTIIYTNASALTMPSGMDRVHLGTRVTAAGSFDFFLNDRIRATEIYPNRLSNLRLEFLTAPVTYTTYAQMANALSYILP